MPARFCDPDSPFALRGDALVVAVRIVPKAGANAIAGIETDATGRPRLKVRVTAVPESGKANAALIRLLAKTWGLAPTTISVARGARDRNKELRIAGDGAALQDRLERWLRDHQQDSKTKKKGDAR